LRGRAAGALGFFSVLTLIWLGIPLSLTFRIAVSMPAFTLETKRGLAYELFDLTSAVYALPGVTVRDLLHQLELFSAVIAPVFIDRHAFTPRKNLTYII
jgi:hypothetical protein